MAIGDPLTIEWRPGKNTGIAILKLTGPITLHNLFGLQAELRGNETQPLNIFDLTDVPYMDSAGMGTIINHYVHCQKKGCKLVVAGVNSRALELFKLTKVNTLIPMFATV